VRRRVLILDTSVLCCWLQIPGREEAGPEDDRWDYERVNQVLDEEKQRGSIFVLPLATVIETGNHVAQAPAFRYERASELGKCLRDAASAETPWAAFIEQSPLWTPDNLRLLANSWPQLAAGGITLADATIKDVAEYYARGGYQVQILTSDQGLKSYEPRRAVLVPRRRT
jgi:hypothetical protein